MRYFLLLFSCMLTVSLSARNLRTEIDKLLVPLDEAIAHSEVYVIQRQQAIRRAERNLVKASAPRDRLRWCQKLFQLYLPYRNDSAIYYLNSCGRLFRQLGDQASAERCKARVAQRWSSSGFYEEAHTVLMDIDTMKLDREGLGEYYYAWQNYYGEVGYYSTMDSLRRHASAMSRYYENLMIKVIPKNDLSLLVQETRLRSEGRLQQSMALNDRWMRSVKKDSHSYALVAFYRYLEYKSRGDTVRMAYWLVESALNDVRHGVLDQGSCWELANMLMELGDIDRAYNYISYTNNCTARFGSRQRNWLMASLMSEIADTYKQEKASKTRQLYMALGGALLLAVTILYFLVIMNRQRLRLNVANLRLNQRNRQMVDANEKMRRANEQLSDLNQQLNILNARLAKGNQVKEEYVAHFMGLCTLYLDKLDRFRSQVSHLVKLHSYDQLARLTNPNEYKGHEHEDFYEQFDESFLHLFPNFVDDFNNLLRPEERIEVKKEGCLTPSLRIFALIRLGIDDSFKIAEFLNYSVNTIYNYRAKTKNKARGDRDRFEEQVKKL